MKNKIFSVLILMLCFICAGTIISSAAISVNSVTVDSGGKATVSVTSNVPVLSYKVTATSYSGLTLTSSSGGTGAGTATITDASDKGMTSLATYTFTVPQVTTDTVYNVNFLATIMEDENFNAVADSSATAKITVKAPVAPAPEPEPEPEPEPTPTPDTPTTPTKPTTPTEPTTPTKSSNANLSNLITAPVDFTGFKASKTTGYSITVGSDVDTVKVTAKVQHSGASYKVTGNTNLKEGTNVIKVTVTAEDGVTKKTYEVKVYKLAEEEIIPNVIEEPEEIEEKEIYLKSLTIEGIELKPAFDSIVYEYTIELEEIVEKLNINAISNVDSAIIEVEGNGEFSEGENEIKIILKDKDGNIVKTYLITVIIGNKSEEQIETISLLSQNVNNINAPGVVIEDLITDEYKTQMLIYRLIGIACVGYLAAFAVYVLIKERKVVERKPKYVSKRVKY